MPYKDPAKQAEYRKSDKARATAKRYQLTHKAEDAAYRLANADRYRKQAREQWSKMTPEQKAEKYAKNRANRAKHPERRERETIAMREWRAKHPDRWLKSSRKCYLNQRYGLSLEQYREMHVAQGGTCAICGKSDKGQKIPLSVDHDHKTGKVRALLCRTCNSAIGLLKENPVNLLRATAYLFKHQDF